MFLFLDESGNFTKHNHEEYFVIGSFTVGDQRRTAKAFRAWRDRFPRKMRSQAEIKWSQSGITDDLRIKTLKYIAKLDVRIRFGYLLRNNIPSNFRKKGKIESGKLYTNIITQIIEQYFPNDEKEIHVFCDQRSLNGVTKKEFEQSIRARILTLCPPGTVVQVEMVDSTSNANMQIVDWISGALNRYLEKSPLGEECYKILKNNFLDQGKEFFT